MQKRVLPKDDNETLTTMFYLANSLDALNRQADGIELRKDLVAATTRKLHKDHPEVLTHQYLLANALEATQRHGEAPSFERKRSPHESACFRPTMPTCFAA